MGEYRNDQIHHIITRRGRREMEEYGMSRDIIPTVGDVGERWKDMEMTRDIIPTEGDVGDGWENMGI